jgi:hypothetical protein
MSSSNNGSTWEPRDEADATAANVAFITETNGNGSLKVAAGKTITSGDAVATEVLSVNPSDFGPDPTIVRTGISFMFAPTTVNNYGFFVYNTAAAGANVFWASGSGATSNQFLAKNNYLYDENGANALYTSNAGVFIAKPISGDTSGSGVPSQELTTAITLNATTDHTLTATETASRILVIGGTTGGSTNVIAPAVLGACYTVNNNTGSNIVFKKAGGTGVTIATAKTAEVFYNGTNYIRRTADA